MVELVTHRRIVAGRADRSDLLGQRAHLVTRELIAWPDEPVPKASHRLHHAARGGLTIDGHTVTGGDAIPLQVVDGGLPREVSDRDGWFHLAGHAALAHDLDPTLLATWLTGQLAVSVTAADGRLLTVTGLQLPGVLDACFATDDVPLGPTWSGGVPSLALWAPTAKAVSVRLFASGGDDGPLAVVAMTPHDGVWSVTGEPSWNRVYYLFEVEVYVPELDGVVTNRVTDPYSVSLAADSARSQLIDLDAPELAPAGWSAAHKPAFAGQRDLSVYELHVRDFSAADPTVPAELRGTYRAFTLAGTAGVRHLGALAEAGLSHLQLLPINDVATIPERREDQRVPAYPAQVGPDSAEPQAIQQDIRDLDAFNWGYDPWHHTVPEGSYATEPSGVTRIVEVREMIAAINALGLRVVVDVVYNHTFAAGQDPCSVLDRIVPGYYHRRTGDGEVETSTCCPNTATEHRMMARLVLDSVRTWVTRYRVDGFRFDLMGHHPRALMLRLRAMLDALTVEADAVDGPAVVLYGEGWNFGEVADDARFVQATQANLAGSGIGTFDDRLRDAARGGSPFADLEAQGFLTGLAVDPNGTDQGTPAEVEARARELADRVRLGVAGSLADVRFETATGEVRRGRDLAYGGVPAGYAGTPTDQVAYVSKHDNETLFDALQYKLPVSRTSDERVRVQVLGLATVAYAQGTPFFHAGSDLLRSKSLDRDSYDAGDRWNAIDWSRATTNWGVGLPNAAANRPRWPLMRSRLSALPRPEPRHLDACATAFREQLAIRSSSELFRLPSSEAVAAQLAFHATGPDAPLGVIAWSLRGGRGAIGAVLVVLNASPDETEIADAGIPEGAWGLHPVLLRSADALVRTAQVGSRGFRVPPRTAAVFVRPAGRD